MPAIQKVNNDKGNLTLTKIMYDLQFQNINGNPVPTYSQLHQDIRFYQIGLSILRKYNPSLEFLLPSNLQQQLNLTSTPQVAAKEMYGFGLKLHSGSVRLWSFEKSPSNPVLQDEIVRHTI
jgi:hypothetical protein